MFFCKNCKKNIGQNIIYMMMDNSFCSEKCRLEYFKYQKNNNFNPTNKINNSCKIQ
jgi:predicted nucleic acid-binding Zn ribbon protein